MNDTTDKLVTLAEQWKDAKRTETLWRNNRIAIEEEMIALTGCKEEGSQTSPAGEYKITITGKITRTLDKTRWAAIEASIPEALRPVTYEPKLETRGLRYLEQNEPDVYARVAQAISAKPAKPAVEVKE